MPRYWLVICPEPHVRGGLWPRWYRENCVAAGWGPPTWSLDGSTDNSGWATSRKCLKEIQNGDKVIPFLLKWRIGPVGTVTEVMVADLDWNPTVDKGQYRKSPGSPGLGRRVLVTWERNGMPSGGKVAVVPPDQRSNRPLARHTVEELSGDQFSKLRMILGDSLNWIDVATDTNSDADAEDIETSSDSSLSLLERDLQKFLSRNLDLIEPGLRPHPEYQLEEYPTEVGDIDLLCQDAQANWVVVELKAGTGNDKAVGQILGYMNWAKENLPNGTNVRGVIVCDDATDRLKSAVKFVPKLSVKRFRLSFSIEDME